MIDAGQKEDKQTNKKKEVMRAVCRREFNQSTKGEMREKLKGKRTLKDTREQQTTQVVATKTSNTVLCKYALT